MAAPARTRPRPPSRPPPSPPRSASARRRRPAFRLLRPPFGVVGDRRDLQPGRRGTRSGARQIRLMREGADPPQQGGAEGEQQEAGADASVIRPIRRSPPSAWTSSRIAASPEEARMAPAAGTTMATAASDARAAIQSSPGASSHSRCAQPARRSSAAGDGEDTAARAHAGRQKQPERQDDPAPSITPIANRLPEPWRA